AYAACDSSQSVLHSKELLAAKTGKLVVYYNIAHQATAWKAGAFYKLTQAGKASQSAGSYFNIQPQILWCVREVRAMRSGVWLIAAVLAANGCAQDSSQRIQAYSEDGMSQYRQGHFLDARESFEAALALKAGDAALLYNIGQCHEHEGNSALAEKYYQQCLERDPNHVACHHALTTLLVRTQRMPEAVKHVEGWLTSAPKSAAAHAEAGWLWHEQGALPRAQARLEEALLQNAREWRALTELGLVYEGLQRPDRALVLYEQSLVENPNQPEIKTRMIRLRAEGAG